MGGRAKPTGHLRCLADRVGCGAGYHEREYARCEHNLGIGTDRANRRTAADV